MWDFIALNFLFLDKNFPARKKFTTDRFKFRQKALSRATTRHALVKVVMWSGGAICIGGRVLANAKVQRMASTASGRDALAAGSLWTLCRRWPVGEQPTSNRSATGAVQWPRDLQLPRGRGRVGPTGWASARRRAAQRCKSSRCVHEESSWWTLDVWTSAGD